MSASVNAHVQAYGQPIAVSLDDETHVFHFNKGGDWRDNELLLVNRNGNHFRLMLEDDGRWAFIKTWNKLFEFDGWMDVNLRRPTALELLKLTGVGPQGNDAFEALSLLPKDAAKFGRKAVWRGHILGMSFDRNNDTFAVSHQPGDTVIWSPHFKGQPWKSQQAALWCKQNLPATEQVGTGIVTPPPTVQVAQAQELKVLEDSPMWGMF